jgi:hypothetical protein
VYNVIVPNKHNDYKEGEYMVKKNILTSKMKLFGDTQESLSEALNLSLARTNMKINGTDGAEFTSSEIYIMTIRYNLTAEEVVEIFLSSNDTIEDIADERCN